MLDVVGVSLGRSKDFFHALAVPVKLPDEFPCGVVSQEALVWQDEVNEPTVSVNVGDPNAPELTRKTVAIHLLAVSKGVALNKLRQGTLVAVEIGHPVAIRLNADKHEPPRYETRHATACRNDQCKPQSLVRHGSPPKTASA
ncbi:MAG TPA: hypothetical protein VD866_18015 [Urbifossiella sp.]|nr:hypothetical protein [Urbifossiella sp.]